MMKKTLLLAMLCILGSSLTSSTFSTLPTDILEIQPLLEKGFKLKEKTLGDAFPYADFSKVLEKYCSASSISSAQKNFASAKTAISQHLPQTAFDRLKLFTLIKNHILTISNTDREVFCQQKYLGYQTLDFIQSLSPQQKESGVQSSTLSTGTAIPAPTPQLPLSSHSTSDLAEHHAAPMISITADTSLLQSEAEKNFHRSALRIAQQTVNKLFSAKLLDHSDLTALDSNIKLSYTRTCDKTRGSFHMLKNPETGTHRFKEIRLVVSLCQPLISDTTLSEHILHVLGHELGHYIYFFKDKKTDAFNRICRDNKNKKCGNLGFPSQYAQTSKEEDYAESFSYRFKSLGQEPEHSSASISEQMHQKSQHFDQLHQSLLQSGN